MKKLLILIFVLSACAVHAQYIPMTGYGYKEKRIKPDSVLHIPVINDSLLHSVDTSAQIRIIGNNIYWHYGYWRPFGSGGGIGQNIMNANLVQDAHHTQTVGPYLQIWNADDGSGVNTSNIVYNYSGFQTNANNATQSSTFSINPSNITLQPDAGGYIVTGILQTGTPTQGTLGLDNFGRIVKFTSGGGGGGISHAIGLNGLHNRDDSTIVLGGELDSLTTITSNVANQLNWAGAFTTSAQGQYYDKQNPFITLRGTVGDTAYNKFLAPSFIQGANTQYRVNLNLEQADNAGGFSGGQLISLQFDRDLMPKVNNQSNLGTTAKYLSSGYIANEYSDNIKFLNNGYLAFKNSGSTDLMRLIGGSGGTSLQLATHGNFNTTSNGYLLDVKGSTNTGSLTVSGSADPVAPIVNNVGVAGATTYTYKIVGRTTSGSTSAASSATSTTTGNATLTGSNYNLITWTEVVGYDFYDIYRTVGGATQGKIGSLTVGSFTTFAFNDVGLAGDGNAEPTVNTTGNILAETYGTGLHTGTPAYSLQVDASGNVIEGSVGGGGQNIMNADLTQDVDHTQTLNDKLQTWIGNDGAGNVASLNFNYSAFQINAISASERNNFTVNPQYVRLGDSLHNGNVIAEVKYSALSPTWLLGLGIDGFNHYYDPSALGGGGGSQRFAIEDNTGITNRYNNFQNNDLRLDSLGNLYLNSGDRTFAGAASSILLHNGQTVLLSQNSANNYSAVQAKQDTAGLFGASPTDSSAFMVTPLNYILRTGDGRFLNSDPTKFLSTNSNGNLVLATGGISLTDLSADPPLFYNNTTGNFTIGDGTDVDFGGQNVITTGIIKGVFNSTSATRFDLINSAGTLLVRNTNTSGFSATNIYSGITGNRNYTWPDADVTIPSTLVSSVGFTGGLISVANPTTTPAFTVAGTSGGIPYFSSTSTWASSGLLAANSLMIGGGAGTAPSTTTTASGALTFLGTPSSANLRSLITDETGTGLAYFQGGDIGTPSAGVLTNATGLPTAGLVNNAVTYAKLQQGSAYTMLANNTASTANFAEITYENKGIQTYAGTDTWDGVAPNTSVSKQYQWTQVGKQVNLELWVTYTNAGTTNTTVDFSWPADLPLPIEPTGRTATNDVVHVCTGRIGTSTSQVPNTVKGCFIIKTGTGTYKLNIQTTSIGARTADINVSYVAQ